MKKIFNRFGQKVSKYRKRLIYGILALFIGQICFFNIGGIGVQNQVFAETNNPATQNETAQKKITELDEILNFFQKSIYVLLYPLLVLAGKLVDNSLVYGEVFGFDAVLWKLWNIVRNLANYALGFIFIYKIFEYLLKKNGDIKKLLISSLIAGIGIQASWFIMAALIDVSTILTYGVGGLPITILGNDEVSYSDAKKVETEFGQNPYILKNVVYVDADNIDQYHIYLTNTNGEGQYYISACKTVDYKTGIFNETLILSPDMIYYPNKEIKQTDQNRCHYYGQVYYFGSAGPYLTGDQSKCITKIGCQEEQNKLNAQLTDEGGKLKNMSSDEIIGYIKEGKILQIIDAHSEGDIAGMLGSGVKYLNDQHRGLDTDNKWTGSGNSSKLNEILSGSSYVGVFTALYSSLINSGKGAIPNAGLFPSFLNTVLSVGHMVAIGIPLIVVVIIFMMRIGILWAAIALSPFIILLSAFEDLGKKMTEKLKSLDYFNPANLIGIIFSPAIICFAISLSTVLVVIISKLTYEEIETTNTPILGGLVEMDIAGWGVKAGKLVIAMLGIAITWFLVWAAVESSKLGKSKIVESMKNLATNAMGSVPIIPVPTKDGGVNWVGANTAGKLPEVFSDKMQEKSRTSENQAINAMFDREETEETAKTRREEEERKAKAAEEKNLVDSYVREIKNLDVNNIGDNWIDTIKIKEGGNELGFSNMNPNVKQQIIEEINELEKNKRKILGQQNGEIQVGDDTYIFNNKYKYEKKATS